ncbi:FAD-dependent oxidoreductase [Candidatus Saccharibacteria bacterium]|nr:FAD-dependent oxidoreductase [Candidatus Saccharibacteria bacterium]
MMDLAIIGSGPAALTAAIYAAREGLNVTVYEKTAFGGLLVSIAQIDNFPGFPDGVNGGQLAANMQKQAEKFGAKLKYGEVSSITKNGENIELIVDGQTVVVRTVLIATGSVYKKLGVPGESEYLNRGVHYCAVCDGAFYKDKKIAVIGGANSAVQEALFLTRFAPVNLIVRSHVKASEHLKQQLQIAIKNKKIILHKHTSVLEISGNSQHVTGLKLQAEKTFELPTDGVFIFAGMQPANDFVKDVGIELDNDGYVKTNEKFETSQPGIFAVGDIRSGSTKQIITACGEGVTAAINIREYLEG